MTKPTLLGVLGAMEPEVEAIRDALTEPRIERHLGYDVVVGRLAGLPVALVQCGVGKVNAALATAAAASAGATALLFVGVAGGLGVGVHVGDVVIARDLVQHDIDVTSMGLEPGRLLGEPGEWPTDGELTDLLTEVASGLGVTVHTGRIASGDQFIADAAAADRIRATFGAIATEMEGAAVAQAAARLGIPLALARWISDTADEGAVADFPSFLAHAAELDAGIVTALAATLASAAAAQP